MLRQYLEKHADEFTGALERSKMLKPGDEGYVSPLKALGTGAVGFIAPNVAQTALAAPVVFPGWFSSINSPDKKPLLDALKQRISNAGIRMDEPDAALPDWKRNMMQWNAVEPGSQSIMSPFKDPSAVAHEFGHSQQDYLTKLLPSHLANFAMFPGLVTLLSTKQKQAKKAAIISALMMTPRLGMEAHASWLGTQALRDTGLPADFWTQLGTFKGVPTYAAAAAAPLLAYYIKKKMGGYEPLMPTIKDGKVVKRSK